MKNRLLILIFFLFLLTYVSVIGKENDSIMVDDDDLFSVDSVYAEKEYFIVAICGMGMTTGSTWGVWEEEFSLGPAFALGLEIPFTKAHIFAFQLYGHTWISKNKTRHSQRGTYISVSDNLYSQLGLSGLIICYLNDNSHKLRFSIHIGGLFLSPNPDHTGLDYGFGVNYSINKNLYLNLSRRLNLGKPDLGGNSEDIPNLLILNVCYKFKLEI